MVSAVKKTLRMLASREVFTASAVFLGCSVLAGASGIAGNPKGGVMAAFQGVPALAACVILIVNASCGLFLALQSRISPGHGVVSAAVFPMGVLLVAGGALLSGLTRFEARVVLSEGQRIGSGGIAYLENPVESARWASPPRIDCALVKVEPRFMQNGRTVWDIAARLECDGSQQDGRRAVSVRRLFPLFLDGALLEVANFGYTPFFRLSSSGEILDQGNVLLRLFPPGSEDFFQASFLPYTFFVRYYPGSSEDEKPHYSLRVARNIDLVLPTRTVAPGEDVAVDAWTKITLNDGGKWAEIRIVRDPGLFLIVAGIVLACAGVFLRLRSRLAPVRTE